MHLYFIRHGESENNALYSRTGSGQGRHPDPALTDIGHQQAQLVAQYLAQRHPDLEKPGFLSEEPGFYSEDWHNRLGFCLTHLYTSLMLRAVVTGAYIAEALDLPLVAWTEIHERGGIFEHDEERDERTGLAGANRAFFAEHHPTLLLPDSLDETGWWNRPFEANESVPERARLFLEDLLERHGGSDDRVAIVSHGGFYNDFLRVLIGSQKPGFSEEPGFSSLWFRIQNTAISRFDFNKHGVSIVYLNRVDHLPSELIT